MARTKASGKVSSPVRFTDRWNPCLIPRKENPTKVRRRMKHPPRRIVFHDAKMDNKKSIGLNPSDIPDCLQIPPNFFEKIKNKMNNDLPT